MPFVALLWLFLPWLIDVWLTVMVAEALSVDAWVLFLLPMLAGLALLLLEWRRVRGYWQALQRREGSPWQLLASARRALAAFLLILPGLGSDVLALLLLFWGGRSSWRSENAAAGSDYRSASRSASPPPAQPDGPNASANTNRSRSPSGVIEGEYRREE